MEIAFQFRFAAHEDGLHFFGGLEFEILPQVAVGTRDADLLAVLGNFFVHQLLELAFAFLQAAPGNDERFALFLRLLAADQALQVGIKFDDPRHERALGQFVKDRAEQKAPHRVAGQPELGPGENIGDERAIGEEEVAQTGAAAVALVMLVALAGREDGAEQFRIDQLRPLAAVFAEPVKHFAGRGMFPQAAIERGAEFGEFAGLGEDFRHRGDEAGIAPLHELEGAPRPALAERGGQDMQNPALLGRGEFREDVGQPWLFVDDQALKREIGIGAAQLRLALDEIVAADE